MTTYKLGLPAELRHHLEYSLPRQRGSHPFVRVTPRDRNEKRCAAYEADHYEVNAYYVASDIASLGPLEEALRAVPGVYLTTQLHARSAGSVFTNPAWPPALGTARRDRDSLRTQTARAYLGIATAANYPPARCGHLVTAAGLRVYPPGAYRALWYPLPVVVCVNRHVHTLQVTPVTFAATP